MPEWVTVARAQEISDGQMVSVTVDGIELLVANVGGEYRSIGDVCTHAQCSLAEGEIEDGTVICPCHGSVFDLRSGEVLESPATRSPRPFDANRAPKLPGVSRPAGTGQSYSHVVSFVPVRPGLPVRR